MKKISFACSLLAALVVTHFGFAASNMDSSTETQTYGNQFANDQYANDGMNSGNAGYGYSRGDNADMSYGGNYADGQSSQDGCCAPADKACGDCYCLMCHYEPCYYNTTRCEQECCPVYKKCCKYVPKYYQKQCCRMVPQYYCVTCCKYEPCYYTTCSYVNRPKYVCERHCKYVPRYYYKHTCQPTCDTNACCPTAQ